MLFTYPLMTAVQSVSARVGRTTGRGLAGNMRQHCPTWLLTSVVILLLTANAINIGADLGGMADASRLVAGGPQALYVLLFGAICIVLQIFLQYTRYVSVLKWLTLFLLAYVATMFMAKVSWLDALRSFVVPSVRLDKDYLTTVVAVLGTTISPYLFFWQASQEVEDLKAGPTRRILRRAPEQAEGALNRIHLDTLVGMGISNFIALAILITAAATLHVGGVTDIQTTAQAAQALRPIAGPFAEILRARRHRHRPPVRPRSRRLGGIRRRRGKEVADRSCPSADGGQSVLCCDLHRHDRRHDYGLYAGRSYQGALLERGDQRSCCRPGDGGHDVARRRAKSHG